MQYDSPSLPLAPLHRAHQTVQGGLGYSRQKGKCSLQWSTFPMYFSQTWKEGHPELR